MHYQQPRAIEKYHNLADLWIHFQPRQRQIRGLQRNTIECFAKLTFRVESRPPVQADTFTCYEERPECLAEFGWCRVRAGTGGLADYGFCSEVNYLPDTPSYR